MPELVGLRERDLFMGLDTHTLSRDVLEVAAIRDALDDGSDLLLVVPLHILTLAAFLVSLPKPLLPLSFVHKHILKHQMHP